MKIHSHKNLMMPLLSKSQNLLNDFDVMGFIFKQQMKFQTEQDVAFERQQRRKDENQRRFQEMILKNFKQN